jgi:hypothetical protein
MIVSLDGADIGQADVANTSPYWEYGYDLYAPAGTHTVRVRLTNYLSIPFVCARNLWLDTVTLDGQPFSLTSYRNEPLASNAPIDSNSASLVAALINVATGSGWHGVWMNSSVYTQPVYTVGATQPGVRVQLSGCTTGFLCDQNLQGKFNSVPLPGDVQVYPQNQDSDSEVVVYQPSTDKMWEFWDLQQNLLGQWTAGWGGYMGPDNTCYAQGYPQPVSGTKACPTAVSQSTAQIQPANQGGSGSLSAGTAGVGSQGAAASGIPLLAGLQRISEGQAILSGRASALDHVLAISIPHVVARRFDAMANGQPCAFPDVPWPAQKSDGEGTDCATTVPEGTRFRLPVSLNIDALNPPMPNPYGRAVAKTVQRYGMVVTDSNSNDPRFGAVAFYGERPQDISLGASNPWTTSGGIFGGAQPNGDCSSNPPGVFCNFPWNSLQVLAIPPNPW